jgi:tripartite-type tricarboxylate transporter receptor subunit TctC
LVNNADDAAIVRVLEVAQYVGRSLFVPPGVPADRLALLKKGFEATMRDEAFTSKLRQSGLDLDPRPGEATQQAIANAMANRDAIVARMKANLDLN